MSKISIIGLGYVGLPLARLFATKYSVVGFDINAARINELNSGIDSTLEIESDLLKAVLKSKNNDTNGLFVTNDKSAIADSTVYVITVPTPVDNNNNPDLTPLIKASETVGAVLKKNDIVVYESTVYPGATEEDCIPVLERVSGLKFNSDFFVGYSPERINPGDKEKTVEKILKVTSGSNPETAETVDQLYKSVIKAGTFKATSIKVAEAAKVIENSQRDINIAFVNELSKIFHTLGIDTNEVLEAAGTKWNFLPFKPGLVGGHCIGVDPYYLAQKAESMGYLPELILAGRRMNESMADYVASQVVKLMLAKNIHIQDAQVLVLGATFKENCPDIRNTKIIDLVAGLKEYSMQVEVYDPVADSAGLEHHYHIKLKEKIDTKYDAVILAVSHTEFNQLDIKSMIKPVGVIYDIKGLLDKNMVDGRL
jgi:UDP-N-acetyl-D-glucosamine/UDP-N-acetyl-D-galactosamine dehydrogenase